MKPSRKWLLACAALAVGALVMEPALAGGRHHHRHHGGRISLGFHFGVPLWPAPYYYHPAPVYYYPTPVVVQPASPPVYVERSEQQANPAGYWYYCNDSRAYYPYVKDCPGGWQRVSPTPPG